MLDWSGMSLFEGKRTRARLVEGRRAHARLIRLFEGRLFEGTRTRAKIGKGRRARTRVVHAQARLFEGHTRVPG